MKYFSLLKTFTHLSKYLKMIQFTYFQKEGDFKN